MDDVVVVDAVPILLPVGDGDVMGAYGAAARSSSRPDDVRFCNNNRMIMVLWMWLLRLRKEDVRTRLGAENGHHFKYNDVCCIIIMTTPTIHHLTNSKLGMIDQLGRNGTATSQTTFQSTLLHHRKKTR
jgi:hypothetical protein